MKRTEFLVVRGSGLVNSCASRAYAEEVAAKAQKDLESEGLSEHSIACNSVTIREVEVTISDQQSWLEQKAARDADLYEAELNRN